MKSIYHILALLVLMLAALAGCYPSGATTEHTPIPTLPRATLPAASRDQAAASAEDGRCKIVALDLIGAWVEAGKPETESFDFESVDGLACQGEFADDVHPLFNDPNLWFQGAMACSSCHNADLQKAAARMDLSSYEGILAGSDRDDGSAAGKDILAGPWDQSILYTKIFTRQMPPGRPSDSPEKGPEVSVGKTK